MPAWQHDAVYLLRSGQEWRPPRVSPSTVVPAVHTQPSQCTCAVGRCRMSKFWLLVYLDFFESLRPSLFLPPALNRAKA